MHTDLEVLVDDRRRLALRLRQAEGKERRRGRCERSTLESEQERALELDR